MLKCAPKFVILISNLEFDRLTEGAMAYCDKCGAYIPDGQSKCLACGYDAEEEKRKAAAQASCYGQTGKCGAEFVVAKGLRYFVYKIEHCV